MKYIYADNFRGFQKTLCPLKSVNFFVGENSTGKTSLLSLVNLLTSNQFWMDTELQTRKIGLGDFKDLVSIESENKKYFSVGMINEIVSNENYSKNVPKRKRLWFVVNYREFEGVPKAKRIVLRWDEIDILIDIRKTTIKYKYSKVHQNNSDFSEEYFHKWISENLEDNNNFSMLEDSEFFSEAPTIMIIHQVFSEVREGSKTDVIGFHSLLRYVSDMAFLAPIRTQPKKTYDEYTLEFSPEGHHTPYLIKKELEKKSTNRDFHDFLRKVGRNSGLFKDLAVQRYGRSSTSPFELDIILDERPISVNNVGYGISQILPVIVESFSRPQNSWIAIQQPEVHLHPRAQAMLGDLFYDMASYEGKRFIIETHSDYTIDRFRMRQRKSDKPQDAQVIFFERTSGENILKTIEIRDNGDFSDNQPASYREFFIKEELANLGI